MLRSRIPFLCLLIALGTLSPTSAALLDYAVGDSTGRVLRLNVPDDLTVVRGILIRGNGAGGDASSSAEDPELVAFARSLEFAVLGTGYWANFGDAAQAELAAFTEGLAQLAARSGHPELVHAPWLPIGHSNGGQMSYGLNALRPERVIAMVVSKGAYYVTSRPAAAALRTPGLLIAGEADTELRRAAIRDLFEGNRPRGALWAWCEEEATGHEEGASAEVIRPFIEECVRLRLPPDGDPRQGPVALRELSESSGWLVESGSARQGFARIFSYADYPAERSRAGWLPSERMARVFRAFASYHKPVATTLESASTRVVAYGAEVVYRLERPASGWQTIDVYEGVIALARLTPASSELAVRQTAGRSGYLSFHSVVTAADGAQRCTMPRRVFVQPPPAPLFIRHPTSQSAAIGAPLTLSGAARFFGSDTAAALQWRRNGRALPGALAPQWSIAAAVPADAGIYDLVATQERTLAASAPSVVGLVSPLKVAGAGLEVASNLTPRPDGNTYDQILLTGAAASLTADPGQVTRLSFIDLSDDIVQVEFSGAGTMTLCLDNATGPAESVNYRQPGVRYMRGHASIVISGADDSTNLGVFSVGALTTGNPGLLRNDVRYDGLADLAFIAIHSPSGRFGGVRTGNVSYLGTQGITGIHAPGVRFTGPVYVGDICAADAAQPVLLLGAATDVRVTGGDLMQLNQRPVQVSGLVQLQFADGTTSHGLALPAQPNRSRLQTAGLDVTAALVAPVE